MAGAGRYVVVEHGVKHVYRYMAAVWPPTLKMAIVGCIEDLPEWENTAEEDSSQSESNW